MEHCSPFAGSTLGDRSGSNSATVELNSLKDNIACHLGIMLKNKKKGVTLAWSDVFVNTLGIDLPQKIQHTHFTCLHTNMQI